MVIYFIPSVFAFIDPEDPVCVAGDLYNWQTGLPCSGGEASCQNGATNPPACTNSGPTSVQKKASLFVSTSDADNISQTSATLHGIGGYDANSSLPLPAFPITAYFRYSPTPISPIFCNDIYGTSMISTKDIKLNVSASKISETFYQKVNNLTPNTTYYYCAIISNKENIAYGGSSIVKEFHTNCIETTVDTNVATNIRTQSANLNGSYCSTKDVKTSFKYREAWDGTSSKPWTALKESVVNHIVGNNSNVYGNFNFNLSGLTPEKKYEFQAVAENGTGTNIKTFEGSIEDFTTLAIAVGRGGSKNDSGTGSGGVNTGSGGNSGGNNNNPEGGTGSGSGVNTGSSGGGVNTGSGSYGSGIINNTKTTLALGQNATPPSDAIVRYHEGIETVFARQIVADTAFAKKYGYQDGANLENFAWNLADQFARVFGYIDQGGKEIRVSVPDVAAYQLQLVGNKLTVYEYYGNKIVDVRNITTVFKSASGYEYYFKK